MLKNNKMLKKALYVFLIVTVLSLSFYVTSSAAVTDTQTTNSQLKITTVPNYLYLTDNNENTSVFRDSITISANEDIHSIYIKFWNATPKFTITIGEKVYSYENSYLHTFVAIPSDVTNCRELTVKFEEKVQLSDIYAFKAGELPNWVQLWKEPCEKADMLLFSSFPGDEHSYLSGIIPYYAKVKQYNIQVVSLVNYKSIKNHELLNGLWEAGVQNYPIISDFPYVYSTTENNAANALKNNGFTLEDVYEFQTEAIRRFKPLVVIGQDLNGENTKVGQRILFANALTKAIDYSSNSEMFPESSKQYGLWTPKKVYIHLYDEKQITLNWDTTSDTLGGLSPFQVSQKAFKYHNSLIHSATSNWLNGNNNITKASEITDSSPMLFGLYYTSVGNDVNKGDFFENLISYDEQEKIEQEKYKEQLEKQKEKEEESKRIEDSLRLESEAEASREAEKQEKRESERLAAKAAQEKNNSSKPLVIAVIILTASLVAVGVILVKRFFK